MDFMLWRVYDFREKSKKIRSSYEKFENLSSRPLIDVKQVKGGGLCKSYWYIII